MSSREVVALGTASQVPTRERSHHATLLRWDGEAVLFDPGEGTQRQLSLAGVAVSAVTRICITHFHGDHCLGLPGVLQRLALERPDRPVDLYFPASGARYLHHLRDASVHARQVPLRLHPVRSAGLVDDRGGFRLWAEPLDHETEAFGWRLEEPDGIRMVAEQLKSRGISGPAVGTLLREGVVRHNGVLVRREDVSVTRPGQVVAFVMDTRRCEGASRLARGADLLIAESTFQDGDEELAARYGHLTAAQAGTLAAAAGARRLLLTHYSQRYGDVEEFARQARAYFPDVVAARDLLRVEVPPRRLLLSPAEGSNATTAPLE